MNQCSNCEAKDQITIAGKTFCANCGNQLDEKQTAKASTVKTDDIAPDLAPQKPVASIPDSPGASTPVTPAPHANPTAQPRPEPLANPTPIAQPSPIPADPIAPAPSVSPVPPPPAQPIAPATPAVQPDRQPIQKAPPAKTNPNQPASRATTEIATVLQKGQDEAALNKLLQKSQPATGAQSPAPAPPQPKENLGSELGSLDSKSEAVFSDAQLNELAKATKSPATNSGPPRVASMSDIQHPNNHAAVEIIPTRQKATPPTAGSPVLNTSNSGAPSIMPPTSRASAPITDIRPANSTGDRVVEMAMPTHLASSQGAASPVTKQSGGQASPIATAQPSQQPKISALKPATVALSLVGLVLVGLYVWQINYPNLAFKVASGKAGINASLPNYLPSGWRVAGNIQANPGVISYNLSSNDNNQQMNVQEAKSDWDSQALAENYVSQKSNNYLALQAQGLTIYMYGDNQASWINNGTWYRLEGNHHDLNQDQVIKIATSL